MRRSACDRSFETRAKGALLRMTAVCAERFELATDSLDIVAVGIDQESGEIARAVVRARAGATIVAASRFHPLGVEFPDRGVIGRTEGDMGACAGQAFVWIEPQRRSALGPEACAGLVARTQDISK